MTKEISIAYQRHPNGLHTAILLTYTLEKTNDDLLLICAIASSYPHASDWLNVRRFSVRARLENKRYTALFDDNAFSATMDVSLFIDQAYKLIMHKEQLPFSA